MREMHAQNVQSNATYSLFCQLSSFVKFTDNVLKIYYSNNEFGMGVRNTLIFSNEKIK